MVLLEAGHDAEVRLTVLQNVDARFGDVVMLTVCLVIHWVKFA